MNTGQARAGTGGAGARPGGDHDTVGGQLLAAVEADPPGPQGGGAASEQPARPELGQRRIVGEGDVGDGDLAEQEVLRQRGAVVGGVGLGADDGQLTVEALGPQRLGRAQPGQGGPDHHHPLHGASSTR